jgi:hypothetical protein
MLKLNVHLAVSAARVGYYNIRGAMRRDTCARRESLHHGPPLSPTAHVLVCATTIHDSGPLSIPKSPPAGLHNAVVTGQSACALLDCSSRSACDVAEIPVQASHSEYRPVTARPAHPRLVAGELRVASPTAPLGTALRTVARHWQWRWRRCQTRRE